MAAAALADLDPPRTGAPRRWGDRGRENDAAGARVGGLPVQVPPPAGGTAAPQGQQQPSGTTTTPAPTDDGSCVGPQETCTSERATCEQGATCAGRESLCRTASTCTGQASTCGEGSTCTGPDALCVGVATCSGAGSDCFGAAAQCDGADSACSSGATCNGPSSDCTGNTTLCTNGDLDSTCTSSSRCTKAPPSAAFLPCPAPGASWGLELDTYIPDGVTALTPEFTRSDNGQALPAEICPGATQTFSMQDRTDLVGGPVPPGRHVYRALITVSKPMGSGVPGGGDPAAPGAFGRAFWRTGP
jgi:hypothetical protein